ncbi:Uncharacterized protein APZ42_029952 [Daphnia magna]|uniref:HAT C-terminal dimerisation domain-containing protein n=1 Tax=Daphnia magna TaxID=35525 RepID=A0A162D3X3_9CRUS|nr:Uncharacterized protein APZ42_029952 [Daphnia magna]
MKEFSKDSSIVHCESLVLAVISGLHTRFGEMFKNVHMRLASVTDPTFKTIWADESEKEQLITLLKSTVRRHKAFNLNAVSGEYNSALPSSAACERVFSTAGLIFTAKRTRLSDLNFEILVFFY